jgi:hypothetical protein
MSLTKVFKNKVALYNISITNLKQSVGFIDQFNRTTLDYTTQELTDVSISNNILSFTTTGTDSQIWMYNIFSLDPNVYKWIQFRYRITQSIAQQVETEVFFNNDTYPNPTGPDRVGSQDGNGSGLIIQDGNWHVAKFDMVSNANWTTGGNITGFRLDPLAYGSFEEMKMEIDYVWVSETSDDSPFETKNLNAPLGVVPFVPIFIYTGGARTSNITTRKYDVDGNQITSELWPVDSFSSYVDSVAVDKDENVYVVGNRTSNITTRKYDSSGTLIWSVDHGADVASVAVDQNGNVYTGGFRTSSITTRKYDSSGNLIWSKDHGNTVWGIAVDKNGNVYTGGQRASNLTTRKYDSLGNLIWSKDHGSNVRGIAVDKNENVYTFGERTSNITTRKYDSSGNLIWSVDHGSFSGTLYKFGIAVDKDGNVYTGGPRSNNITTRKYNLSGNLIWSRDHGATVEAIAIDKDRNVYTVGYRTGNLTTRKYDSSGTLLWSVDHVGFGAYGVSTFPPQTAPFV